MPGRLLEGAGRHGGAAGAADVAGAAVCGLGLAEITEKVAGTALGGLADIFKHRLAAVVVRSFEHSVAGRHEIDIAGAQTVVMEKDHI